MNILDFYLNEVSDSSNLNKIESKIDNILSSNIKNITRIKPLIDQYIEISKTLDNIPNARKLIKEYGTLLGELLEYVEEFKNEYENKTYIGKFISKHTQTYRTMTYLEKEKYTLISKSKIQIEKIIINNNEPDIIDKIRDVKDFIDNRI